MSAVPADVVPPPLGRLDQLGVIVRDLDAVEAGMLRVFGLRPRHRSVNQYRGSLLRGEPVDADVAVPDHAAAREAMARRGVPVCQEGDSVRGGGVAYAYYETSSLVRFFLETLNAAEADEPGAR